MELVEVGRSSSPVERRERQNNLSAYLECVRNGEEMLVKDRHRLIARLMSLSGAEDMEAEELEMAAGLVRFPEKALLCRALAFPSFCSLPARLL